MAEQTTQFTTQNSQFEYTVPPKTGSLDIEIYGGVGGSGGGGGSGGSGGYISGTLTVSSGEKLTIYVGEDGEGGGKINNPGEGGSSPFAGGVTGETGTAGGDAYDSENYIDIKQKGGDGGGGAAPTAVDYNGTTIGIGGGGGGGAGDYYEGGEDISSAAGGAGGDAARVSSGYGGTGAVADPYPNNGNSGGTYVNNGYFSSLNTGTSHSEAKVIITANLPTQKITDISSSTTSNNEIDVFWTIANNSGTLNLYRFTNNPKNNTLIASLDASQNSYHDSTVSPNQTYGYYIIQEYENAVNRSYTTVEATSSERMRVWDGNKWQYTNINKQP